jgi:DNA-binding transcriptional MocR family regulator
VNILVRYRPVGRNASEISASVETAIRGGELAPGDHLPPVRALAQELGVSPTTVAAAYRELRRRGITTGAGRGGTQIRPAPPVGIRGNQRPPDGARDLLTGAPDPSLLPALPGRSGAMRLYADTQIAPRLRGLAAERLAADGIDPANLAVTGGALDGIERVLATWLTPGDRVAVEDPGHAVTFDLVAAMGLVAVPVPVDGYGMRPAGLTAALDRGVNAVIFTPRAQAATGAAWDAARAAELRSAVGRHPSAAIIEDDHAGPVSGTAVHSLCAGMDRWVNIRSVSKSLGPDLRLAVLAGDEATIARVAGRQALGTGWVSFQLQETVADLWHDPAIARAAQVYAGRREALLAALAGQHIPVTGGRSGLTCWIPVTDEDRVTAAMTAAGWAIAAGRRYRIAAPPGVRICFATLTEAEAAPFAADLARALLYHPPRHPTRLD